ncbi:MAG: beta-propeller domain-containing protein [Lachnospiraceae bacterium]|nr:beta-propeller domain-containing protein [Lachnospiraceae bacterium]
MNEQEMLEQLKAAAEHIEIPDEIKPEQMRRRLKEGTKTAPIRKIARWRHSLAAAIAVVLCGGIAFAASRLVPTGSADSEQSSAEAVSGMAEAEGKDEKHQTESIDSYAVASIGETYRQAESYEEVYELVSEYYTRYYTQKNWGWGQKDGYWEVEESADAASFESYVEELNTGAADYSTTNLQTEGVDEGDIIKTDGHFIYRINTTGQNIRLLITDISGETMEEAAEYEAPSLQASDSLREVYAADGRMVLLAERRQSRLMDDGEDIYQVDSRTVTKAVTIDLSDPLHPKELGVYEQEGGYVTSRMIGDILYLFTRKGELFPEETTYDEEKFLGILPCVQGNPVPYHNIYLAEEGNTAMVISSVDIRMPEQSIDSKLLVDDGSEIYVGKEAAYLYSPYYRDDTFTDIAKFTLKDGKIVGVNAHTLPGAVYDTFAIHEQDGYLRVLTTDESQTESVNALYILDKDMEPMGSLTGIAKGEEIYAARFIGDIGYFVTYHNTDPLFTADLSDPANPKLIGQLDVTGFSDYLHVWDSDHLLGIGCETDPDDGRRLGIKLSMYNISDPANVYEEGKCVIKDMDDSPALFDYKSVLISSEKNIIGLEMCDYSGGATNYYTVFSYEDGAFKKIIDETLEEGAFHVLSGGNTCRSLYVGDKIYVVDGEELRCFLME